jgi:hypothetical protein
MADRRGLTECAIAFQKRHEHRLVAEHQEMDVLPALKRYRCAFDHHLRGSIAPHGIERNDHAV